MASETEPAKLLLPYLQRADELQKHDPLVAYYCGFSDLILICLVLILQARNEFLLDRFILLLFDGTSLLSFCVPVVVLMIILGRLYAMERGLKIPQGERTKTTNSLLISLMNQLEKVSSADYK